MPHISNIEAFLDAAKCSNSPLIQAYCGLVAIELAIKSRINCSDHNVPDAMKRLARQTAAPPVRVMHTKTLTAMAVQLTNDLTDISCQDKAGNAVAVPGDKFPYMRYTRFAGDGWGAPETSPDKLKQLAASVKKVRFYLKQNFGMPL